MSANTVGAQGTSVKDTLASGEPLPGETNRQGPATAVAAVGMQAGPRRGLPPGSRADLYERAWYVWETAWHRLDRHEVVASWWDLLDTWARLVLAVVAGLSAITLIQDRPQLALVFAVTTAFFSAVNAALDPATRSKTNRDASRAFRRVERAAGQLLGATRPETVYVGNATTGYYAESELTGEPLKEYGSRLLDLEAEFDGAWDAAPPLHRFSTMHPPRTAWGLKRLEKRRAMAKRAEALMTEDSSH